MPKAPIAIKRGRAFSRVAIQKVNAAAGLGKG